MPQPRGDSSVGICRSCGQKLPATLSFDRSLSCPHCGAAIRPEDLVACAGSTKDSDARASKAELAYANTIMVTPTAPEPVAAGRVGRRRIASEGRLLRLLARVDRSVAGRRLAAAATIVFACAITGPLLDACQHNVAPVWTVVLANAMLLLLWVLAFAWLGAMRDDAGASTGAFAWRRLRMLGASLFHGYEELRGAATRLRWQSIGKHLVLFGCLLLIFRDSSVLVAVAFGAEVLRVSGAVLLGVGCACFVLGVALLQWAAWSTRNATPTELAHARSSIGALTAIVDLNRDVGRQFSGPDPVSLTLSALAQWRLRAIRKYPDVHAYKEALERHLRIHVHVFKCRREIWLGKTREDGIADLLIGGAVWVGIARGFSSDMAAQVLAEVRRYPKTWADKPKVLVIFDAGHRDVFDNAVVAALQQLHEQASLVAVRM